MLYPRAVIFQVGQDSPPGQCVPDHDHLPPPVFSFLQQLLPTLGILPVSLQIPHQDINPLHSHNPFPVFSFYFAPPLSLIPFAKSRLWITVEGHTQTFFCRVPPLWVFPGFPVRKLFLPRSIPKEKTCTESVFRPTFSPCVN